MKLSILVIAYDMPVQAMNTLLSLSSGYQRRVQSSDYEVVVVENRSQRCLDGTAVEALPGHFRYFLRDEPGVSPAAAINFGVEQCRGEILGLFVDGARMATPGLVELVLAAARGYSSPLVCAPAYHLGGERLHEVTEPMQRLQAEQELLQELHWQNNGYRLFEGASWSEGNKKGCLQPLMEANALFVRRDRWLQSGGANEAFDMPGGGCLILHTYRTLAMMPENQLIVLPGEGNFHQYHGGVTTSHGDDRSEKIAQFSRHLDTFWGGRWKSVTREPVLLGRVGAEAQALFQRSCEASQQRFERLARGDGASPWPDQDTLELYHGER